MSSYPAEQEFKNLLSTTVLSLHNRQMKISEEKLAVCCGRKGRLSSGKLMVIGRAANGWGKDWDPRKGDDGSAYDEFVERPLTEHECQMKWVHDPVSHAKQSRFLEVAKSLTKQLEVSASDEDWASYLIWSNLYKLSPNPRGNPSTKLGDIQFPDCARILKKELSSWRPQIVVMITGLEWAEDFLTYCFPKVTNKLGPKGTVEQYFRAEYEDALASAIVIATKRPEGKQVELFVNHISSAIVELRNTAQ